MHARVIPTSPIADTVSILDNVGMRINISEKCQVLNDCVMIRELPPEPESLALWGISIFQDIALDVPFAIVTSIAFLATNIFCENALTKHPVHSKKKLLPNLASI